MKIPVVQKLKPTVESRLQERCILNFSRLQFHFRFSILSWHIWKWYPSFIYHCSKP